MRKRLPFWVLLAVLIAPWHVWGQNEHSISLSWTYTQGADIATGFNIYRAAVTSGPYTKLNAAAVPVASLSFTDSTAVAGTKYFYIVTAVDAAGFETQSSEVSATMLPSPLAPAGVSAVAR